VGTLKNTSATSVIVNGFHLHNMTTFALIVNQSIFTVRRLKRKTGKKQRGWSRKLQI